jgi:hypothetical protein
MRMPSPEFADLCVVAFVVLGYIVVTVFTP